ncbi:unnamed protein product [Owenia fusiformis]|uniref:Transmembrane protein 135 N-terminal domain-containing protein n=1 Tax=Owenia fusiformis TaxID=6347 RepID=A0A8S4PZ88_OWEFU|nr:unnamed protein product [Owenia fusiformis]
MAAQSKILYNSCYELGHTWTPYCSSAVKEVAVHGFLEAFKIYAPLYVLTALFKRRKKEYYLKRLLPEILQSTAFLGTNAFLFMWAFCAWRRLIGHFNFLTVTFIPALTASLAAILLERKSRRGMLAVYMGNVAIETAWRMATARGLVTPINNGEVLLFSAVTAIFMYLSRCPNGLPKTTLSGISWLVGSSEFSKEDSNQNTAIQNSAQNQNKTSKQRVPSIELPEFMQQLVEKFRTFKKHRTCQHRHSCLSYCYENPLKLFGVGYAIQAGVKVLGSLSKLFSNPSAVVKALIDRNNLNLGAFLASFLAIYRTVLCSLRWMRDHDSEAHGLVAGFLAGWSMGFYKSTTIALYLASKLAETMYMKGVDQGSLPHIRWADILLYSLATSFVFHAAVFEPHNLRPAYWKFLLRLTNNRFAHPNRDLLLDWKTRATQMFPDFVPQLDVKFCPSLLPSLEKINMKMTL